METLKIVVIGDEVFVTGFNIVGVGEGVVVDEKSDVNKEIEKLLSREDIGIIITNKEVFGRLNERLKDKLLEIVKPTVVVVSHDIAGDESLRLMIKKSLGIDVWRE